LKEQPNKNNIPISFSLQALSFDYFFIANVKDLVDDIGRDIRISEFKLKTEIGGKVEFLWDKNLIQDIVMIKLFFDENDKKILLCESHTAFDYIITNPNDLPWWNDKSKVPQQFLWTLRSVSYSTTRGMMFMKLSGTYLNKFFLPIIDPRLLKNPAPNKT
jgi:hypothetical protein